MAGKVTISMDTSALMKALQDLPKAKMEEVDAECEAAAREVERLARQRVPTDMGQLANSITVFPTVPHTYEIVVQKFYAPFVEFGTGQNAAQYLSTQSPELNAYARQYYVNGQGTMRPRPFLFPAFYSVTHKLAQRLAKILNR